MGDLLNKAKRRFRNQAEIEQILGDHQRSGLSIKAFCAASQIAQASFHHWKKKYQRPENKDFAPVHLNAGLSNVLFAEAGGVKLYQPVSAAYLEELMA